MDIEKVLLELYNRAKKCPKDEGAYYIYNNDNKDERRFDFSLYSWDSDCLEFHISKIFKSSKGLLKKVVYYSKIKIKITLQKKYLPNNIAKFYIDEINIIKNKGENISEFMLELAEHLITLKEYEKHEKDKKELLKVLNEIGDKLDKGECSH